MSEIQGKPVYGICECKEKRQVLSVEQVTDLIQQMAANNWQVPAEYIPKTSVNGIIEQNEGRELKLWLGTQAKWDAFTGDKNNVFAIISDDPTLANIDALLKQYGQSIDNINNNIKTIHKNITNIVNGATPVSVKKSNGSMGQIIEDENGVLKYGDIVIPEREVLWTGSQYVSSDSTITLNKSIAAGDVLEIKLGNPSGGMPIMYAKCYVNSLSGQLCNVPYIVNYSDGLHISHMRLASTSSTTIKCYGTYFINADITSGTMSNASIGNHTYYVYEIARIIE